MSSFAISVWRGICERLHVLCRPWTTLERSVASKRRRTEHKTAADDTEVEAFKPSDDSQASAALAPLVQLMLDVHVAAAAISAAGSPGSRAVVEEWSAVVTSALCKASNYELPALKVVLVPALLSKIVELRSDLQLTPSSSQPASKSSKKLRTGNTAASVNSGSGGADGALSDSLQQRLTSAVALLDLAHALPRGYLPSGLSAANAASSTSVIDGLLSVDAALAALVPQMQQALVSAADQVAVTGALRLAVKGCSTTRALVAELLAGISNDSPPEASFISSLFQHVQRMVDESIDSSSDALLVSCGLHLWASGPRLSLRKSTEGLVRAAGLYVCGHWEGIASGSSAHPADQGLAATPANSKSAKRKQADEASVPAPGSATVASVGHALAPLQALWQSLSSRMERAAVTVAAIPAAIQDSDDICECTSLCQIMLVLIQHILRVHTFVCLQWRVSSACLQRWCKLCRLTSSSSTRRDERRAHLLTLFRRVVRRLAVLLR